MAKFYFQKDDECCYTLDYHKEYMEDNDLKELELYEAERATGSGYFYCKEYCETGETGQCGKQCDHYKPNNGKSGRCKHYGYAYEQTDKKIVLYLTPKEPTQSVATNNEK